MDPLRFKVPQIPAFFEKEFVDKSGKLIIVKVFVYPTRDQNSIDADPRVASYRADISEVLKNAFRDDSNGHFETKKRIKYVEDVNVIELLFRKDENDEERVIGFQSYIYDELPGSKGAKYLYNLYAAILPDEQSAGLRRKASDLILELLKPDVIAGTTHSISYYKSFQNAGTDSGYQTYPRPGEIVPSQIFLLVQDVFRGAFGERSISTLDPRLVRTDPDDDPYTQDLPGGEFYFFEKELNLRPEQGVLCAGVRPEFAQTLGV